MSRSAGVVSVASGQRGLVSRSSDAAVKPALLGAFTTAQPEKPLYGGQVRITRAQRNAVAEKITSLERSFYGRGPRNVKVSVSDDDPISLVVLSVDSLTVADAVLSERGHKQAVIRHHEALHEATKAEFLEAIEEIVGSPVSAYLAQVHPNTGYAVRVFVFSDLGDFDQPDPEGS